ncbi:hypothetical protein [Neobacillus kokaensis]|uniref:Uncharacterized protein n=1 Tax=Neobacillus kokaensis TaxID=2759023 RepID=A0ABQ3N7B1_9BACI|nr:hypothetical protein [Neobacillus kokaensis]GHI00623.1 hypothetical protein AM1BK_41650 [Neobacillus kokaensis]
MNNSIRDKALKKPDYTFYPNLFSAVKNVENAVRLLHIYGCIAKKEPIKPLEEREVLLLDHTFPWVKMWDSQKLG